MRMYYQRRRIATLVCQKKKKLYGCPRSSGVPTPQPLKGVGGIDSFNQPSSATYPQGEFPLQAAAPLDSRFAVYTLV